MITPTSPDFIVRCPDEPCPACRSGSNRIIRISKRTTTTRTVISTSVICPTCSHDTVAHHTTLTIVGQVMTWLRGILDRNWGNPSQRAPINAHTAHPARVTQCHAYAEHMAMPARSNATPGR